MPRVGRFSVIVFLCALLVHIPSAIAAEIPAKERIVILITLDGFPAWLWDDPGLPVFTLRKLAAEGVSSKGMVVSNPAVTWPNHTTLVTGVYAAKHGCLWNGLLTRKGPGEPPMFEPWRDKKEIVRAATLYDHAHKAGLTTANVEWIPTLNAGTFNWDYPERPQLDGSIEKEMIAAGLMTETDIKEYHKRNVAWRDEYKTRASEYIITKYKPNLFLFHILNTDGVNHKFGPGTMASHTAFAYADTNVKRILDALKTAGLYERASIIVATDHGFKTAKRLIRPMAFFKQEGLVNAAGPTIKSCDVFLKTAGGSAMVYFTRPEKKAELLPRLKEKLARIEGVAQVYDQSEYAALKLPSPEDNPQMGELWLTAKPGYAFNDSLADGDVVIDIDDKNGYPGHHGYLNTDPQLNGAFIAWGYGIKKGGVKVDEVRNIDVAPTLARLLGVELPGADGRVLDEILEK